MRSQRLSRIVKQLLESFISTSMGHKVASFGSRALKLSSRKIVHGSTTLRLAYSYPGVRYRVDTFSTKEPETLAWIDSFPRGSTFVDVGANIGLYSVYAGAKGCRVLAIEPGPENIFTLILNVQLNELIDQVHLAFSPLGRSNGQPALICQGTVDPGGAQLGALGDLEGAVISWRSSLRSLDSLCEETGLWPDFLKIDIDGHELELLHGAQRALRWAQQVLIETDIVDYQFEELRVFLESLGLTIVSQAVAQPGTSITNIIFNNRKPKFRSEEKIVETGSL